MELVLLVRPENGITPRSRLYRRWDKSVIGSEHHRLYFTSNSLLKSNANFVLIRCLLVFGIYLFGFAKTVPGVRIGRMNQRRCLAFLIIAACSFAGLAQAATPSLAIGSHVLRIGMPESEVLEQLGADLVLRTVPKGVGPGPELAAPTPPESTWLVEKDLAGVMTVLGQISFASHQLISVSRNLEVKSTSAKSLFYAIDLASRHLVEEGFTDCQLSTVRGNYAVENGSVSAKQINLSCGTKGITIYLTTSDAPNYVSTAMSVREWMHGS